nr:hypothetical protein PanWU01x14_330790 [Ipomoea batatas]
MLGDAVTKSGISPRWNLLYDKSSVWARSTFIVGNGSTRELWERSRTNRAVKFRNDFGTAPEKWFQERSRVSMAWKFPMKSGIFPRNLLCPSSRNWSLGDRAEMLLGIWPENLLCESRRVVSYGFRYAAGEAVAVQCELSELTQSNRKCGNGPDKPPRYWNKMVSRNLSFERDGDIVPDSVVLTSDSPRKLSIVTRPSLRHCTPDHPQQSVPGFHEERIPVGSRVMPDLNANNPDSSSTWHAVVASRNSEVRRVMKRRRL